MTGIGELRQVQVVSAVPEQIRVSVFGGHTQLDVALPLDVPVAGLVGDLAGFVRSRNDDRDQDTRDERRTFWVLSRFDPGVVLRPEQTLREAGVVNGELLRLSAERALSPPTLYDDVVDAVGRLNKAAHAGWDAVSARWMAFAGIRLVVLGLVYCLAGGGPTSGFSAGRVVIVALAVATVLALVGGAAIAHRSFGLDDVAAGLGWAAIPLSAGIAWALLAGFGYYGLAAGCAVLVVLYAGYDRAIGSGRWAYLAAAVALSVIGVALLGRALQLPGIGVYVPVALAATLACLTVRRLTARLGRFETPTVDFQIRREEYAFENPFTTDASPTSSPVADSGVAMPTAEKVWARSRAAALTRAALLTGLAGGAAAVLALLLGHGPVTWPVFAFTLACSAVLALRCRVFRSWFERAGLAVPAVAVLLAAGVFAQRGGGWLPVTGLGVLLIAGLLAVLAGLTASTRGAGRLADYLDYLAAGSLVPLAIWVVGSYLRWGLW